MSDEFEQAIVHIKDFKKNGGPVGEAHDHCRNNRNELAQSEYAGCFYCCELFSPSLIDEWTGSKGTTAVCPKCGIDAIIGDASAFPITDKAFLTAMNKAWF